MGDETSLNLNDLNVRSQTSQIKLARVGGDVQHRVALLRFGCANDGIQQPRVHAGVEVVGIKNKVEDRIVHDA